MSENGRGLLSLTLHLGWQATAPFVDMALYPVKDYSPFSEREEGTAHDGVAPPFVVYPLSESALKLGVESRAEEGESPVKASNNGKGGEMSKARI